MVTPLTCDGLGSVTMRVSGPPWNEGARVVKRHEMLSAFHCFSCATHTTIAARRWAVGRKTKQTGSRPQHLVSLASKCFVQTASKSPVEGAGRSAVVLP